MADPFGIIRLIGVAAEIIRFGTQVGLDWRDAPENVRNFMAELAVLKTILSETNTNLILNQDLVDAFRGRRSALLSQLPGAYGGGEGETRTANSDVQLFLATCHNELEILLHTLQKRTKGGHLGWERLKSAFLASRTREAVENVQRRCQALNGLLAIDALALAARTNNHVVAIRREQQQAYGTLDRLQTQVENREDIELREAVLKWLTPIDYAPQQHDFFSRRHEGTGQWLLDTDEFKQWLGPGTHHTLYCPGIPGAGKTILASIVIDHIHSRFQSDDKVGLAYIFFDFRRQSDQNLDSLFSSLLKQLLQGRSHLPDYVRSLYATHKPGRMRPPVNKILAALHVAASAYLRVFCVIDALDECASMNGTRMGFLSELFNLRAGCRLSLLVTSRFIPEIHEQFHDDALLEIRAGHADVIQYVAGQSRHLPAFVGRNRDLQKEIETAIVGSVKGMFLLAKLHMDSLRGKRSPKAVRLALQKLPTGSEAYHQAYEGAMERIQSQVADRVELAMQVLSWISCARRPLTTTELQYALAVEIGETEFDLDNMPEVQDMVSVCAGLVTVDDESNIIRLVHYTAQQYFERTETKWFPNANYEIAAACTTYLTSNCIPDRCGMNNILFAKNKLLKIPLFQYAARYWGYHAREAASLPQNCIDFLKQQQNVQTCCSHFLPDLEYPKGTYIQDYGALEGLTGLHVAAIFGLVEAVNVLCIGLEQANACTVHFEATPLAFAVRENHIRVAEMLLERGADMERRSGKHCPSTPLIIASAKGHEAIVRLLLERGADIETRDGAAGTPLMYAAANGSDTVVSILVGKGANLEARNFLGRTPLFFAAGSSENSTRVLLERKIDPNVRDTYQTSPLSYAAQKRCLAAARALLERKAEVDSCDMAGRTALSYAACSHDRKEVTEMAELLLGHGADLEAADVGGRTAMAWAAGYGSEPAVRFLASKGAQINCRDKSGRTPLSWAAASREGKDVVRVLLELGADIEAMDARGRTPLAWAYDCGTPETVELLRERGARELAPNPRSLANLEATREFESRCLLVSGTTEAVQPEGEHA